MAYWVHRITEVKGQYRLTLPRKLVESMYWQKGDSVMLSKAGIGKVMLERLVKGVKYEGDISECKDGSD